MKRWLSIGAVLLFMIAGTATLTVLLVNARATYEKAYAQAKSLNWVEMNAESQAFLDDVRANWRNQSGFYDGDGPMMTEFGLAPTVANWAEVQTWKMPPFSYWNVNANRSNAKFMVLQATLVLVSEDGNVYVNQDRSLAYVRLQPNMVYLYVNDPAGLRQAIYVRPQP
jgi:hypothetical protein